MRPPAPKAFEALGYGVFRQSVRGRADQEALVSLVSESSKSADLVYDDLALNTSVALLNPSDQQATLTITSFRADGSQAGVSQMSLPPRTKQFGILEQLAGLSGIAGQRGRAHFSVSGGAISVLGLRSGGQAFTAIEVAHGTQSNGLSALPQLAFGGGWYTAIYFSNPLNSAVSFPVNFIGNDGLPLNVNLTGIGSVSSQTVSLNPGATVILEAPNVGDLLTGWVEANVPPGVVGYAVFRQSIAGRADQEAVVLLTPESSQAADLIYDDIAFNTSVAFLNPTNRQETVTILAFGADGVQVGATQVVLSARSKQSAVLKTLPGMSGIAAQRGRVAFAVPNGSVSVLGLRSGAEAFTSIPISFR